MKPVFIIIVWLVFVVICVILAEWNDAIRRRRIAKGNPKQIEHFWWAAGYGIPCGVIWYISRSWLEVGSLALLHISIFPVAYNHFAEQPAFHLSRTSKAFSDRFMVWIGLKSTEAVNIPAFALSIALTIIQIILK